MAQIGYARVSSTDQNEARQIDALQNAGCERIYLDKLSGKNFERPEYKKMIRAMRENDVLFIHSLDRLGRNYELIKEQWQYIVKKKKAHIVVLDMPLLDTRQGQGLIGQFISDIVLQLLAFVSQQERDNIKKRQAEGIAAAKRRGVKFGKEPKPLPRGFKSKCMGCYTGVITLSQAAKDLCMSRTTFIYNYRIWEAGYSDTPKQFLKGNTVGTMPETFVATYQKFKEAGIDDLTEFSKDAGISRAVLKKYWNFWKRQAENKLSGGSII